MFRLMVPARTLWPFAWGAFLVTLVTWPFFLPGEFLWRDMVIVHHMGFTPANFGGGDLAARNAPQDGLLAFFSLILPATWLVRGIVISAAAAAAWAGHRLAQTSPTPAMALAVVNPFAVERLLQGQWSLAVAAWLLPVIAAGLPWLKWLALFGASLTPTGALLGLVTALVTGPKRAWTLAYGVIISLPWLVPGLLSSGGNTPTDAAAGVAAFAPRAEAGSDAPIGTIGSLLTLGGIWNSGAIPSSRAAGFALFGLIAVALIVTRLNKIPRGLVLLAALGLGGAVAAWCAPNELARAIAAVPGLGILRDAQKLVALAIPAYVTALGALPALRGGTRGRVWTLAALASLFLQMPDACAALDVLRPTDAGIDSRLVAQLHGRSTFFANRPSLIELPGGVAVDPYSKVTAKVESGELAVDGKTVDYPSNRWRAANDAWDRRDLKELEKLGIGAVVDDGRIVAETPAPSPRVPWALTLLWLLTPLAAVPLIALNKQRTH